MLVESVNTLAAHMVYETMVLNLCVGHDPFVSQWPFHRGCLRPSENTDIYITCHKKSNITVVTKIIFPVQGQPGLHKSS